MNRNFIFPRKTYKTKNNITFKSPLNLVYSITNLANYIEFASEIKITEKFRPDIDTINYSNDINVIKVMSLLNGKPLNIFDYAKDETVLLPSISNVNSTNASLIKSRYNYDTTFLESEFTKDSIQYDENTGNILDQVIDETITLVSLSNDIIEQDIMDHYGDYLIQKG